MEHVESRVVLDIDLDILAENYRKIAASVAPLQTVVVLKAGAYGLGMRPVAQALAKAGAAAIATAELAEALAATDLGLPVRLRGTVLPGELEPALRAGVRVPVPYNFIDGVLVMELVKDSDGQPAPRLGDLSFEPAMAKRVFDHRT